MLITDVRIGVADLNEAARFYRDVLELPVTLSDRTGIVTVGRSTVTLMERSGLRESNHLAFTIPSNRFADAKKWLAARVELMSWADGETELCLGEPWNSESVYFLGPDSILLEVITRQHLANPSDELFSSAQLLCVSEVGLAAPEAADTFAQVRRAFGVDAFAGELPDFTPAGDQDGLLILVTEGRPWFPTDNLRAATETVHVSISGVADGRVSSSSGWTVTGSRSPAH